MTLQKKTLIAYHRRVIELRAKEMRFKEIYEIVEAEYFVLANKRRYKTIKCFLNMFYKVNADLNKR